MAGYGVGFGSLGLSYVYSSAYLTVDGPNCKQEMDINIYEIRFQFESELRQN